MTDKGDGSYNVYILIQRTWIESNAGIELRHQVLTLDGIDVSKERLEAHENVWLYYQIKILILLEEIKNKSKVAASKKKLQPTPFSRR